MLRDATVWAEALQGDRILEIFGGGNTVRRWLTEVEDKRWRRRGLMAKGGGGAVLARGRGRGSEAAAAWACERRRRRGAGSWPGKTGREEGRRRKETRRAKWTFH